MNMQNMSRLKGFYDLSLILASLLLLAKGACAGGPWCFQCQNALHPAICFKVTQCGEHELCHTEVTVSSTGNPLYTSSCKAATDCAATARRRRRRRASLQVTQCDECCNGTLCNAKGCNLQDISNGRLFCLSCDFVQNPADCDVVDQCSLDDFCLVSKQVRLGLTFFNLGCQSKTSCPAPGSTLAKDKALCCDTDICNSNDIGVNPSIYTTTPVPTTRKDAPADVTVVSNTLVYNVKHEPGETMDIVCHVTGGPPPTVSWSFDDGNSVKNITTGISTGPKGFDSILSIPTPSTADSGVYTCYAENPTGKGQQDITVTVLTPPHIDGNQNTTVTVKLQDDLTIPCVVQPMDNSTTVKWEISPNIRSYTINADNSLKMYNVHSENTGDYTCVAENADGKVEKVYHVEVEVSNTPSQTLSTAPPSTTMSTTTTKSSSGTTTTTTKPTTTPTTQMTTKSTTSTTAKSTPTSSSATTTQATTQPTKSANVAPGTTAASSSSAGSIINQFIDVRELPVSVLQCPVISPSVTWRRLVVDFDHSSYLYIDNGNGVLAVLSQTSPDTLTGLYECVDNGVIQGHFVIYNKIPDAIACNKTFSSFAGNPGDAVQVKCPPCANPNGIRPALDAKASDYICETAISKQLIFPYGGEVTYVMESGSSVRLVDPKAGNILF
ncbi:hypothetical protein EGW08_012042 [Elysia chlorotica]|uniref:Ig-like domain-containing protein n=1 Tax=Elysia chlorotica TaxID=188477 RepID=A0A3S1HIK4_ELYCH|nr:hypothetical protein EGW08_012042 [Elysia chlorotica]